MDEFATGKPGGDGEFEVLLYEFKSDLNKHLAGLGPSAPIKTLKEAIAFNEAHKDREMPLFGQELFEMAEKKGPLTDASICWPRSGTAGGSRGRSASTPS